MRGGTVKRFARCLGLLTLMAVFVALGPTAQAAQQPSGDPNQGTVIVTSGQSAQAATSSASGCGSVWEQVTYKDVFGITLWWFKETVNWCWGGGLITSKSVQITVYTNLGWAYDGIVNSTNSGGVGKTYFTAYRQAQFHNCQLGICIYKYPWTTITVYSNGTYTGNGGG